MKEFEVTVQARNNRLKERRVALGLSQAGLAKSAGVSQASCCHLETMHDTPVKKDGTWTKAALSLAEFFKVDPGELFPPAVIVVEEPKRSFVADGSELLALTPALGKHALDAVPDPEQQVGLAELGGTLERLLGRLTPQKEAIIRRHFGFDSSEETMASIGRSLKSGADRGRGLSRARVAQIEDGALNELRKLLRREGIVEL